MAETPSDETTPDAIEETVSHVVTPAEAKARNRRNLAVAGAVVAFVLIVYSTTILRLVQNIGGGS